MDEVVFLYLLSASFNDYWNYPYIDVWKYPLVILMNKLLFSSEITNMILAHR